MDLVQRAGDLKPLLTDFALSSRFDREFSAVLERHFPDHVLTADSVGIHFVAGEGLSFYPDYHLIEELFSDPRLISRPRYRETLSGFLRDPDTSPEPLRRLAARDPAKASRVFARLLKRKRFSWDTDGEQLLRRSKPRYFDETPLPRTVPLSPLLSEALQRSR